MKSITDQPRSRIFKQLPDKAFATLAREYWLEGLAKSGLASQVDGPANLEEFLLCKKAQSSDMDPTEDEASAITDLGKAYGWAGVPEDIRTTLGDALGGPTLVDKRIIEEDNDRLERLERGPPGKDQCPLGAHRQVLRFLNCDQVCESTNKVTN